MILNLVAVLLSSVFAIDTLYPKGLVSSGSALQFAEYALIADKAKREIFVYRITNQLPELIAQYPADIGKKNGAKQKENDLKTPEGIYFLEKRLSQPEIPFDQYGSMAFTTDYPNIFDRREQKTGYGIWLHSVPDSVPLTRGSRGCVVVRNDVINTLSQYVKLGQTPILIYDQTPFISKDDYMTNHRIYRDHFNQWKSAWENQDVDAYIKYYDTTFRNDQMNYKQWYRHKKNLKKIYQYIKVEMAPPLILSNSQQVVIRTSQKYESDLHQDFGEKTIHANYSSENGFLIVREDWKPISSMNNPQVAIDKKPASTDKN